jgi:hypothetical protein
MAGKKDLATIGLTRSAALTMQLEAGPAVHEF